MREQSITKGFAVLSAAGLFVKVLSFLYIPFLLAIIGEEGNGIYAAAYQVYVFVFVLTNSGVPVAISKLVSELTAQGNYKDAIRSFKIARALLLLMGTLMSLLLLFSARFLSSALNFQKSYLAIAALSPTLLFTAVASAYRGYFQGRSNMTPTAISQVLEQIINTVLTLVFAALLIRHSLEAACAGGTIGTSIGALFSAAFLIFFYERSKRSRRANDKQNKEAVRYTYRQLVDRILKYSVPITICVGMQYAGNLVDLWNTKSRLLAAGFDDTYASQLYSFLHKYQQLMNAPIALITALAATIIPAISAAAAKGDGEQVKNKINYAFRLCFLVAMPSAAGLGILSRSIFQMLRYGGGYGLMMFGSLILVLSAVVQIQTAVLQASGKLYTITIHLVLGIAVKILINYFLISVPAINIYGAIIGSYAGFCVPVILNTILIRKTGKFSLNLFSHAAIPFFSSVIMGVAVWFFNTNFGIVLSFISNSYIKNFLSTLLSISLGAVIYLFGLIAFRGITRQDLELMPSKATRLIPSRIMARIK